jgi:hypothetical protein
MKSKPIIQLRDMWSEINYGLRCLCGKPSPLKRLLAVSILVIIFGGLNLYIVICSIYNCGKRDALQDLREMQQLRHPEVKNAADSINLSKQKKYEHN